MRGTASISAVGLLAVIGLWSSLTQSAAKLAPTDERPAIIRGFTAAEASNGAYVVLYGRRGKDPRQFFAPLLVRDGHRTQLLPALAAGDDGSTPRVVIADDGPCIGYNKDDRALVACLSSGRWQRRGLPAGELLADLVSHRRRMVALTIGGSRRHIERRVYAATARGWRRLAVVPRVVSQSTVGLAQTWSGTDSAVVFTLDARPGARGRFRVLALRQRRWREVTHDWRTTFSPFRKGPVVTSDGVLVALTEIHGSRGDFALVHLGSERSGRVFRRPAAGLAQGALSVTRSGSWIWWQDHILEPKGALRIDAYAGAVDACTGKVSSVQRFWHGRAAVPISAEIVELAGRPTVLYLKSGPDPDASPRLATVALRVARASCR